MGSSSLGKWNGKWIKDNFPEAYRDLCTSFIDRGFSLSNDQGYSAMVTMQSWMFLGSYEKLRGKLLRNHTISSMAHLGTRAFGAIGGEVVSTTATVFANKKHDVPGTYLRLVDMQSEEAKREGALEALANPDCEWRHKQASSAFGLIPGSPIAYWIESATLTAFADNKAMKEYARTSKGLITGDNDEFFRLWWEISHPKIGFDVESNEESLNSGLEWFPLNKGGKFRKWYGNNEYIIHWAEDGQAVHRHAKETGHHSQDYDSSLKFKENISWSDISTGLASFRYRHNELSDHKGMPLLPLRIPLHYCLGFLNSSVCAHFLSFLSPTLSCNIGEIEKLPVKIPEEKQIEHVEQLVLSQIMDARAEWNSYEESWDYTRHPLV